MCTIMLAAPCRAQVGVDTLALLPEIRTAAWIAQSPPIVTRPFVGGLYEVLVRTVAGRGMLPVSPAELAATHVTPDSAFAIGRRNLHGRLTAYPVGMPPASPELSGMRSVEGESVETSRLLLSEDWSAAASELGGPIVAMAPVSGTLIFGRDTATAVNGRKSIPAAQYLELVAGVLMPYGKRLELLSPVVLRWTPVGWQAVPPMTDEERRALNQRPAANAGTPPQSTDMTPAPVAPTAPATMGGGRNVKPPRKP